MASYATAQMKAVPGTVGQAAAGPLPGSHGWANFTSAEEKRLNLSDQQLVLLHAMDDKLATEYNALGIEPWTHAKFPALNARRDKAIRAIMTPEQYKQWSAPVEATPLVPPTIIPDGE